MPARPARPRLTSTPTGNSFVQMDAVQADPGEYFAGPGYLNRPNRSRLLVYRLFLPLINRRVAKVRALGRGRAAGGTAIQKAL